MVVKWYLSAEFIVMTKRKGKNMKKIISAFLACVLCAGIAASAAGCGCQKTNTSKNVNSGGNNQAGYRMEPTDPDFEESDFAYYRLNDNEVKITKYNGNSKNIKIPSEVNGAKVVVIEANLFQNSDIETVEIPNTVTEIQSHAFAGCQKLTEVNIPEGVKVIGENAFWTCRNLKKVTLPSTLKKIGYYAFSATGLTSVTIPESNTFNSLSDKVFFQSADLAEVTLPTTMTTIADNTFEDCSPNLTIKAYAGSYGVSYAQSHGFKLVEMPR